ENIENLSLQIAGISVSKRLPELLASTDAALTGWQAEINSINEVMESITLEADLSSLKTDTLDYVASIEGQKNTFSVTDSGEYDVDEVSADITDWKNYLDAEVGPEEGSVGVGNFEDWNLAARADYLEDQILSPNQSLEAELQKVQDFINLELSTSADERDSYGVNMTNFMDEVLVKSQNPIRHAAIEGEERFVRDIVISETPVVFGAGDFEIGEFSITGTISTVSDLVSAINDEEANTGVTAEVDDNGQIALRWTDDPSSADPIRLRVSENIENLSLQIAGISVSKRVLELETETQRVLGEWQSELDRIDSIITDPQLEIDLQSLSDDTNAFIDATEVKKDAISVVGEGEYSEAEISEGLLDWESVLDGRIGQRDISGFGAQDSTDSFSTLSQRVEYFFQAITDAVTQEDDQQLSNALEDFQSFIFNKIESSADNRDQASTKITAAMGEVLVTPSAPLERDLDETKELRYSRDIIISQEARNFDSGDFQIGGVSITGSVSKVSDLVTAINAQDESTGVTAEVDDNGQIALRWNEPGKLDPIRLQVSANIEDLSLQIAGLSVAERIPELVEQTEEALVGVDGLGGWKAELEELNSIINDPQLQIKLEALKADTNLFVDQTESDKEIASVVDEGEYSATEITSRLDAWESELDTRIGSGSAPIDDDIRSAALADRARFFFDLIDDQKLVEALTGFQDFMLNLIETESDNRDQAKVSITSEMGEIFVKSSAPVRHNRDPLDTLPWLIDDIVISDTPVDFAATDLEIEGFSITGSISRVSDLVTAINAEEADTGVTAEVDDNGQIALRWLDEQKSDPIRLKVSAGISDLNLQIADYSVSDRIDYLLDETKAFLSDQDGVRQGLDQIEAGIALKSDLEDLKTDTFVNIDGFSAQIGDQDIYVEVDADREASLYSSIPEFENESDYERSVTPEWTPISDRLADAANILQKDIGGPGVDVSDELERIANEDLSDELERIANEDLSEDLFNNLYLRGRYIADDPQDIESDVGNDVEVIKETLNTILTDMTKKMRQLVISPKKELVDDIKTLVDDATQQISRLRTQTSQIPGEQLVDLKFLEPVKLEQEIILPIDGHVPATKTFELWDDLVSELEDIKEVATEYENSSAALKNLLEGTLSKIETEVRDKLLILIKDEGPSDQFRDIIDRLTDQINLIRKMAVGSEEENVAGLADELSDLAGIADEFQTANEKLSDSLFKFVGLDGTQVDSDLDYSLLNDLEDSALPGMLRSENQTLILEGVNKDLQNLLTTTFDRVSRLETNSLEMQKLAEAIELSNVNLEALYKRAVSNLQSQLVSVFSDEGDTASGAGWTGSGSEVLNLARYAQVIDASNPAALNASELEQVNTEYEVLFSDPDELSADSDSFSKIYSDNNDQLADIREVAIDFEEANDSLGVLSLGDDFEFGDTTYVRNPESGNFELVSNPSTQQPLPSGFVDKNVVQVLGSSPSKVEQFIWEVTAAGSGKTVTSGVDLATTANSQRSDFSYLSAGLGTSDQNAEFDTISAVSSQAFVNAEFDVGSEMSASLRNAEFETLSIDPASRVTVNDTNNRTERVDHGFSQKISANSIFINGEALAATNVISAQAVAQSVNSISNITGVNAAVATNQRVLGVNENGFFALIGEAEFRINGVDIRGSAESLNQVITAINDKTAQTGVLATNQDGNILLTADDGRNINVRIKQRLATLFDDTASFSDGGMFESVNSAVFRQGSTFEAGGTLEALAVSQVVLTSREEFTITGANSSEAIGLSGTFSPVRKDQVTLGLSRALEAGEISINGESIDAAERSAVAVAAAINAANAGVTASVLQTQRKLSLSSPGASQVDEGQFVLNGSSITSGFESAQSLVNAINNAGIEGVEASLDGNDILLTASDGRNIELQAGSQIVTSLVGQSSLSSGGIFEGANANDFVFGADEFFTGRATAQIQLQSSNDIVITGPADAAAALGFNAGTYAVEKFSEVLNGFTVDITDTEAGKVEINGFSIGEPEADADSSVYANRSAKAIAQAINDISNQTGVSASALANEKTLGFNSYSAGVTLQEGDLTINGEVIEGSIFDSGWSDPELLADLITQSEAGVSASLDSNGNLSLVANDGRNIEVVIGAAAASLFDNEASFAAGGMFEGGSLNKELNLEPGETFRAVSISKVKLLSENDFTISGENLEQKIGASSGSYQVERFAEVSSGFTKAISANEIAINNILISAATEDAVSSAAADRSAIAVANAINQKTAQTGVTASALANEKTLGFNSQAGATSLQAGDLSINGEAITGTVDNASDLANLITQANNEVTASVDANGNLSLVADDGRNIEILIGAAAANLFDNEASFGANGLLKGASSRELNLEGDETFKAVATSQIELTSNSGAININVYNGALAEERIGFVAGVQNGRRENLVNGFSRSISESGAGLVTINGVSLDAAENDGISSEAADRSAIAVAGAINKKQQETGVTASALANEKTLGFNSQAGAISLQAGDLSINGQAIEGSVENASALADRITQAANGVTASVDADGNLSLVASDGRNISISVGGSAINLFNKNENFVSGGMFEGASFSDLQAATNLGENFFSVMTSEIQLESDSNIVIGGGSTTETIGLANGNINTRYKELVSGFTQAIDSNEIELEGAYLSAAQNDNLSSSLQNQSAIAVAASINSVNGSTDVSAQVLSHQRTLRLSLQAGAVSLEEGDFKLNNVSIVGSVNSSTPAANLVSLINQETNDTGISAQLVNSQEIQLTAADGRNIEAYINQKSSRLFRQNGTEADWQFGKNIQAGGLFEGARHSDLKLKSGEDMRVVMTGKVKLTSLETTDEIYQVSGAQAAEALGLQAQSYTARLSSIDQGFSESLDQGELEINGVLIQTAASDQRSSTQANESALAVANSINAKENETGVRATALANERRLVVSSNAVSRNLQSGDFVINGVSITGAVQTAENLVNQINSKFSQTGVYAENLDGNEIALTADDARNIEVVVGSRAVDLLRANGGEQANLFSASFGASGLFRGADLNDLQLSSGQTLKVTHSSEIQLRTDASQIEVAGTKASAVLGIASGVYQGDNSPASDTIKVLKTEVTSAFSEAIQENQIKINGIYIAAAESDGVSTFDSDRSAMAVMTAVNNVQNQTGVRAEIDFDRRLVFSDLARPVTLEAGEFELNGISVTGNIDSVEQLVGRINATTPQSGVQAELVADSVSGREVSISTTDGRNIEVRLTQRSANLFKPNRTEASSDFDPNFATDGLFEGASLDDLNLGSGDEFKSYVSGRVKLISSAQFGIEIEGSDSFNSIGFEAGYYDPGFEPLIQGLRSRVSPEMLGSQQISEVFEKANKDFQTLLDTTFEYTDDLLNEAAKLDLQATAIEDTNYELSNIYRQTVIDLESEIDEVLGNGLPGWRGEDNPDLIIETLDRPLQATELEKLNQEYEILFSDPDSLNADRDNFEKVFNDTEARLLELRDIADDFERANYALSNLTSIDGSTYAGAVTENNPLLQTLKSDEDLSGVDPRLNNASNLAASFEEANRDLQTTFDEFQAWVDDDPNAIDPSMRLDLQEIKDLAQAIETSNTNLDSLFDQTMSDLEDRLVTNAIRGLNALKGVLDPLRDQPVDGVDDFLTATQLEKVKADYELAFNETRDLLDETIAELVRIREVSYDFEESNYKFSNLMHTTGKVFPGVPNDENHLAQTDEANPFLETLEADLAPVLLDAQSQAAVLEEANRDLNYSFDDTFDWVENEMLVQMNELRDLALSIETSNDQLSQLFDDTMNDLEVRLVSDGIRGLSILQGSADPARRKPSDGVDDFLSATELEKVKSDYATAFNDSFTLLNETEAELARIRDVAIEFEKSNHRLSNLFHAEGLIHAGDVADSRPLFSVYASVDDPSQNVVDFGVNNLRVDTQMNVSEDLAVTFEEANRDYQALFDQMFTMMQGVRSELEALRVVSDDFETSNEEFDVIYRNLFDDLENRLLLNSDRSLTEISGDLSPVRRQPVTGVNDYLTASELELANADYVAAVNESFELAENSVEELSRIINVAKDFEVSNKSLGDIALGGVSYSFVESFDGLEPPIQSIDIDRVEVVGSAPQNTRQFVWSLNTSANDTDETRGISFSTTATAVLSDFRYVSVDPSTQTSWAEFDVAGSLPAPAREFDEFNVQSTLTQTKSLDEFVVEGVLPSSQTSYDEFTMMSSSGTTVRTDTQVTNGFNQAITGSGAGLVTINEVNLSAAQADNLSYELADRSAIAVKNAINAVSEQTGVVAEAMANQRNLGVNLPSGMILGNADFESSISMNPDQSWELQSGDFEINGVSITGTVASASDLVDRIFATRGQHFVKAEIDAQNANKINLQSINQAYVNSQWGTDDPWADVNSDGIVNGADAGIVLLGSSGQTNVSKSGDPAQSLSAFYFQEHYDLQTNDLILNGVSISGEVGTAEDLVALINSQDVQSVTGVVASVVNSQSIRLTANDARNIVVEVGTEKSDLFKGSASFATDGVFEGAGPDYLDGSIDNPNSYKGISTAKISLTASGPVEISGGSTPASIGFVSATYNPTRNDEVSNGFSLAIGANDVSINGVALAAAVNDGLSN
ncbi:MAG: flagellin hook IN motif-containing protein, partial [Bdellovibrionota bacterium]